MFPNSWEVNNLLNIAQTSFEPMPDLSRIAGDPNAPAERTTRRNTRATNVSVAPFSLPIVSSTCSIQTARVPLS